MGYSIMTTFTKKNQIKMLKFLENNFRDMNQIPDMSDEENTYRGPTNDVSYNGKLKTLIGFDYSSWAGQTVGVAYAFRICYWMAVMTGRDYVVYDGTDKWLLSELKLNEFGYKGLLECEASLNKKHRQKYNKIIKTELQKLTELYKQET